MADNAAISVQWSIKKAFVNIQDDDGSVTPEEFMTMVPNLFPSWTACDAQSMLKASGALVDGRVDHQVFAEFIITGEIKAKALASAQAPRRLSLVFGKTMSPSRSPRTSLSGVSSRRASQSLASSQVGDISRTAPGAAGIRSNRASSSPRLSGAAKNACAISSANAAAKLHRNKVNGFNEQQAQGAQVIEKYMPQDPSLPPHSSTNFESQSAEPEPEERAELELVKIASPNLSSMARSKIAGNDAPPFDSPVVASMSTPRTHPSCRENPAGLDMVVDGNRLEKAQARHAACIEHLRSVSHLVGTLETENARLRAKVRELEGGKNDVVASVRTKRNSAVARKTDPVQGRFGCS